MELKEVVFGYRHPFLRIPYLKIEKGNFYAVVGPNGAGKSTLLRIMGGMYRPWEGVVLLDGRELPYDDRKTLARKIALVLQKIDWDVNLSVYDVVSMGRYPYGKSCLEDRRSVEAIYNVLLSMGIIGLVDRKFSELSDGERQRVLVARALVQEPDFLFLDEPISHLDVYHQIELLVLLKRAVGMGVVVVAVLHDLNMANWFSDVVLLMNKGKIVSKGAPEEVIKEDILKDVFGVEMKRYILNGRPVLIPSAIDSTELS